MKEIFLNTFCVLILIQSSTFAQEDPFSREEKIYKLVDGYELKVNVFNTSVTRQNQNNPAIAFFHGGGWVFGNPDEFFGACERFARKGFVTFSFQYRLRQAIRVIASRTADRLFYFPTCL